MPLDVLTHRARSGDAVLLVDDSISSLIAAVEGGDRKAREALFAALYAELHAMARRELAQHAAAGAGLGVTTLLHEAYLAMAVRGNPEFPDRARFMGYAARVMRGVLIDHARERRAIKRGRQFELTTLDTDAAAAPVDHQWLSDLSGALDELAEVDPSLAEVVDLRFFCGFSIPEIAAMSGTSVRTVHRRWEKARLYLHEYLRPEMDDHPELDGQSNSELDGDPEPDERSKPDERSEPGERSEPDERT